MPGTPSNVRVWQAGEVFVAPLGTAAPTSNSTSPSSPWTSLGLLTESDGAERTRSSTVNDIEAWGATDPVRQTENKIKTELKVVALEENPAVYRLRYPDATGSFASGTLTVFPGKARMSRVSVAYRADDDTIHKCEFWSAASVTSEDPKDNEDGASTTTFTFTKLSDSNGTVSKLLTNDAALFPLSS